MSAGLRGKNGCMFIKPCVRFGPKVVRMCTASYYTRVCHYMWVYLAPGTNKGMCQEKQSRGLKGLRKPAKSESVAQRAHTESSTLVRCIWWGHADDRVDHEVGTRAQRGHLL
jgi:hypothetical protein